MSLRRRTNKKQPGFARARLGIETLEERRLLAGTDPLTLILDFNTSSQGNTTDILDNVVGTISESSFDCDDVFGPNCDGLYEEVLGVVKSQFDPEKTHENPLSPVPSYYRWDVDIEIGEIGTPPANGSADYFYLQIGNIVQWGPGLDPSLGWAEIGAARDAGGNTVYPAGTVVGSVITDRLHELNPDSNPFDLWSRDEAVEIRCRMLSHMSWAMRCRWNTSMLPTLPGECQSWARVRTLLT